MRPTRTPFGRRRTPPAPKLNARPGPTAKTAKTRGHPPRVSVARLGDPMRRRRIPEKRSMLREKQNRGGFWGDHGAARPKDAKLLNHAQQRGVPIRRAVFSDDEDQNRRSAFGPRVDPGC